MKGSASKIRAVLFDFDGTLAPNLDLPDMRRQVIELTQANGVPDEVWADRYIVEIIDASHAYLARLNSDYAEAYHSQAHGLIEAIELDAAETTVPFESARHTLTELEQAGIATAIVTRNCSAAVERMFPDWHEHTQALFARDQVETLKPHPGHFETALRAVGSPAAEAAIVSDGAMDMRLGRQLGMRCVGVLTGSADRAILRDAGAHQVFDSITGLPQAILSL